MKLTLQQMDLRDREIEEGRLTQLPEARNEYTLVDPQLLDAERRLDDLDLPF